MHKKTANPKRLAVSVSYEFSANTADYTLIVN